MNVVSEVLREQLELIFKVWGMPAEFAELTSRVMIDTDLRGIDSHGISMLSVYNNWRKMGRIIFDAPITVVTDLPSLSLIDGGAGLGHPIGIKAMKVAINKARETGVGMVTVRQSNHFGAAGYYARMALEHDLIGVAMTGTPNSAVVPTFGKLNMLGTNPIAFAAPTRRNPPFVLDMATSTVAVGKLAVAKRLGLPIKHGWALDEDGHPTTDPVIAREARKLTPLGGTRELGSHKGYGLAAMVDILSSTLSGANIFCVTRDKGEESNISKVGHFFMALNPATVRGDDSFPDELDDLIDVLHATPPINKDQPVLVAGDPELENFRIRSKNGIPVSRELAQEIKLVAEEADVEYLLKN